MRVRLRAELEHRPPALACNVPQLPVGIDGDRMPDGFEERQVGVAVGVRRALGEVEASLLGELAHAVALFSACSARSAWPVYAPSLHLADRAERAVEAELVGDRLDDLLQRRRDDEDALAAFAMLLDEVQRLGIDERAEHRLHRARRRARAAPRA